MCPLFVICISFCLLCLEVNCTAVCWSLSICYLTLILSECSFDEIYYLAVQIVCFSYFEYWEWICFMHAILCLLYLDKVFINDSYFLSPLLRNWRTSDLNCILQRSIVKSRILTVSISRCDILPPYLCILS